MNEMLVIPLEEWNRLVRLDSALRNPSDELIERLSLVYHNDSLRTYAEQMRAVLAALADEFGVKVSLENDTDPRVEAVAKARWLYWPEVSTQTTPDMQRRHITEELAAADAVDPLRAALREPSDELVERLAKAISVRYHQGNSDARYYTARVLAALADEFGVKDDGPRS